MRKLAGGALADRALPRAAVTEFFIFSLLPRIPLIRLRLLRVRFIF